MQMPEELGTVAQWEMGKRVGRSLVLPTHGGGSAGEEPKNVLVLL